MARTGRPPIPTETKRLVGTLRPDRMPQGGAALALVEKADVTDADRSPAEIMDSVFAAGMRWLGKSDGVAISLLRESIEEREALREVVMNGGLMFRKDLRDLDKQIIGQLSLLGFDPAARSRLGLAEVKAADKIDTILARRADRGEAT